MESRERRAEVLSQLIAEVCSTHELAMAARLRGLATGKGKELRYFEFDDKTQKTKPIVFKKKADKLSVQRGSKDPADCNLDNFGICGETDVERLKTEGMP